MACRWTARRRSQTRIEENHTARHDEKVRYLAIYSSGRNRRARYRTGGCADLKALLRDLQNEAPLPPGTTAIQKRASGKWMEGCSGRIVGQPKNTLLLSRFYVGSERCPRMTCSTKSSPNRLLNGPERSN